MEAAPAAIEVEGLTHAYRARRVLEGVSFRVAPGEVVGFLGPNGAGKSTTIKLLLGMLSRQAGSTRVAGLDPQVDGVAVKALAGYVPEHAAMYESLTAREYLTLVGRLHHLDDDLVLARALPLLTALDLAPHVDGRMSAYSKGMRQKVAICAALVHTPKVLLLDEPLTGLDANATIVVKDVIRGLSRSGVAVLYSSHLLDVVERVSDRVLILDGGRIVADGPPGDLRARHDDGTLEALFHRLTVGATSDATRAAIDALTPIDPTARP